MPGRSLQGCRAATVLCPGMHLCTQPLGLLSANCTENSVASYPVNGFQTASQGKRKTYSPPACQVAFLHLLPHPFLANCSGSRRKPHSVNVCISSPESSPSAVSCVLHQVLAQRSRGGTDSRGVSGCSLSLCRIQCEYRGRANAEFCL